MTCAPASRARNRAKARRSTGPRSAAGKARAARNALRHGATARPEEAARLRWLAIILGHPDPASAGLLPGDPALDRALTLAEAEARYAQASGALHAFESGTVEPSEALVADLEFRDTLRGLGEAALAQGDDALLDLVERLMRACLARIENETRPGGPRHRLLRRYAREARARRDRAFRAWLAEVA